MITAIITQNYFDTLYKSFILSILSSCSIILLCVDTLKHVELRKNIPRIQTQHVEPYERRYVFGEFDGNDERVHHRLLLDSGGVPMTAI